MKISCWSSSRGWACFTSRSGCVPMEGVPLIDAWKQHDEELKKEELFESELRKWINDHGPRPRLP